MHSRIRPLVLCAACLALSLVLVLVASLALAAAGARAMTDYAPLRISESSAGNRDSQNASLSGDNSLVAFDSDSDLLGQSIPDGQSEVWLYDAGGGGLTRVTTASLDDRDSWGAVLSADGGTLAFTSDSDFQTQGIVQSQREVWLYDVAGGTLERLTQGASGRESWVGNMTPDGSWLVLESDADLLSQGIADDQWEIWLVDAGGPSFSRITTASEAGRTSYHPRISADGTWIAFSSDSDLLDQGIALEQSEIWLYNTSTLTYTRVTSASNSTRTSWAPSISADGRKVAFISDSDWQGTGNPQGHYEVWLYDVAAGTLDRVTYTAIGRYSDFPALSADGSLLFFQSDADILNEGIADNQYEIWRYDIATAVFSRVTEGSDASRDSYRPAIGADGAAVALHSDSDFLDEGILATQYQVWLFTERPPSVSLTKTADKGIYAPGEAVIYTLVVRNPLTSTLTDAIVSDPLSSRLQFVGPVTLDPPLPGAVLADDPSDLPTIASNLDIPAGSTITLTVPAAVRPEVAWGTQIVNVAGVTSHELPVPVTDTVTIRVLFAVESVSPTPNSHSARLGANLYVTFNDAPRDTSVTADTLVIQAGFRGLQDWMKSVADETITFYPYDDFLAGEQVQATITDDLLSQDNERVLPLVWQFRIKTLGGDALFLPHPQTPELQTIQTGDVGLGDLDGDNDLDAVLPSTFAETTVWLNDGTGSLSPHPTTPTIGDAAAGRAVALGDLNGDGLPDLVIAGTLTSTVWLNHGNGVLVPQPATPELATGASWNVALADMDADGDQDAAVAQASGGVSVWVNDGTGALSAHPTTPVLGQGNSGELVFGDVDADGDLDLLVGYRDFQPTAVWLNDGTGNFSSHGVAGAGYCFGLAAGDLDGDGDLDVVTGYLDSSAGVWINDGSGRFAAHGTTPTLNVEDVMDVNLGDLDGDGDLDAVLARSSLLPDTVWLNDGLGNLTPGVLGFEFGAANSTAVGLGDLDGDGDLDAVVGDASGVDTTVWLNGAHKVLLPIMLRNG